MSGCFEHEPQPQSRQTETCYHAAAAAGLDPDTGPASSPGRAGPGRAYSRTDQTGGARRKSGRLPSLDGGTAVQGMLTVTLTKPRPVLIH